MNSIDEIYENAFRAGYGARVTKIASASDRVSGIVGAIRQNIVDNPEAYIGGAAGAAGGAAIGAATGGRGKRVGRAILGAILGGGAGAGAGYAYGRGLNSARLSGMTQSRMDGAERAEGAISNLPPDAFESDTVKRIPTRQQREEAVASVGDVRLGGM